MTITTKVKSGLFETVYWAWKSCGQDYTGCTV